MTTDEPYEASQVHWFGSPWPGTVLRAPVCDDDRYRIPVPVGSSCCFCAEPIDEKDRGLRYSGSIVMDQEAGAPAPGPIPYAHAECHLRSIAGNMAHLDGRCHHVGQCNEMSSQTYREEARDVWERLIGPDFER